MIDLALDECSGPEQENQLRVAQTAAQSLVTILNDILDLSEIEGGKMTIKATEFDLRSAFQEVLPLFEDGVRGKNLRL